MSWLDNELPETSKAFAEMRSSIFKDSALDKKTKELIAVAAANLLRCEPCMRIHAKRAMEQGATKKQIAEAMAVSMFIASGTQALWSSAHEDILADE